MEEKSGKLIQQMIIPIAVLVAVAMSVVVGFVWLSANNQDRIALRQSIDSVRNTMVRKDEQVGLVAKDYSWWNDAVQHLVLSSNLEWADTGVGFMSTRTTATK